jgi:hypothetical protein
MKTFWAMTLTLASIQCAIAQEVPPPPPMRGDQASLKDTMKFVQDKLPGKVNYIVYGHDNIAGTDSVLKRSFVLSNVSADADACHISFHYQFDSGKNTGIVNKDEDIFLKQVRQVALKQMDQVIQQADAKSGHPERTVKVDPPIFLVVVSKIDNHSMMFNFYEDTIADRVSKALLHAVELCGGGNQEPF